MNGCSDYLHELRLAATERGCPLVCTWEVTTRCALNCRHCYHLDHMPRRNELTTSRAIDFLDELLDAGVLLLLLTGGEPFARPDIWALLDAAARREFATRILSSGVGLRREDVTRLASLSPLSVDLSLYGGAAVHDGITGVAGSFDATVRAGQLLSEHGVRTTVKMPLMRCNISEHQTVKKMADSWGADLVTDASIFCRTDGNCAPLDLRADHEQLVDFMRNRSLEGDAFSHAGNVGGAPLQFPLCSAGRSSFFVSSDGGVFPCAVWREELGRLATGSLSAALSSARANAVRNLTVGQLTVCQACSLAGICTRCSGLAHMETGDPLGCSSTARRLAMVKSEFLGGLAGPGSSEAGIPLPSQGRTRTGRHSKMLD